MGKKKKKAEKQKRAADGELVHIYAEWIKAGVYQHGPSIALASVGKALVDLSLLAGMNKAMVIAFLDRILEDQ